MTTIENFHDSHYFLSNFYIAPMKIDGKSFQTNEHFFQASKASDEAMFELVRLAKTAAQTKKLGREIPMRKNWENIKNEVMLKGLRAKFALPEMRALLLETGDATLIEGNNWHDRYWGRCDCAQHGGAGENWLGRLLMQVREEIRKGTP